MKWKKRDLWYAEMADAFYICRSRKWIAKTTYTQVPLISDEGEGNEKMDEKKVKFVIEADIGYQNKRQSVKKNRRKKKKYWEMVEDENFSVKQEILY